MNTKVTQLKPVTARGAATRRRLLDAAESEFGRKGYHAASVSGITTEAGSAQGTFYLYFRGKEDAFRALVEEIGRDVRKAMALAVADAPDQMSAERAGLEGFVLYVFRHPHLYRIIQEAQFVDEAMFRRYYNDLAEGYARVLNDAADRGEVSPGDGAARAWAMMGIGHFLGLRHAVWNGEPVPKAVLDDTMELIANGMAP